MDDSSLSDGTSPRDASVISVKSESDLEEASPINDSPSVDSPDATAPTMDESDLFNDSSVLEDSSTGENPSSSIRTTDQSDNLDEGAAFEDSLSDLLDNFRRNAPDIAPEGSEPYDSDYEEAIINVERKREEIAAKEFMGDPADFDRVQLKVLEGIVNKFRKGREKENAHRARELEDQAMFIPEDAANDNIEMITAPSRREAMNEEVIDNMDPMDTIDISDDEESEADQRAPQNAKSRGGKGSKSNGRGRKSTAKTEGSRVQKRGQASKKRGRGGRQGPTMTNIGSLLRNDIVADARANQDAGELPNFDGARNKRDALAALIGSIPLAERGRGEKATFDKAARQFRWKGKGSMRVKDGGWRLKGMTTSLKNFQLLSAAWGCEREAGTEAPFGGMLADTMGYGKVSHTQS